VAVTAPPGGGNDRPNQRLRRAARIGARVGWGFGDQAVSSLGNFLLGFFVARNVDTATFGAFSIAYTTYVVALGVLRGAVAQPLMIRYSGADERGWRAASARGSGFALAAGLVIAVGCLALGVAIGGTVGGALVALAIPLPALLVQDTWRYALFAHDRGRSAFINDLVWLAIQVPALLLALRSGGNVVVLALLAWGGAGAVAAAVGAWQVGVLPRPTATRAWLGEHRALIPRFVAEAVASLTSSQLAIYGVGALAGLTTLGQLRLGQLLIGPILVLFIGLQLVAVPQAVRALGHSVARLRRLCVLAGLGMAAIAVAWGAFIALLPSDVGEALLKSNWAAAQSLVFVLSLGLAAASISSGALIGLRAFAAASRSLRATVISSTITTVATIGGAVLFGAIGAAWGIFLAHTAEIALWWWEFDREARSHLGTVGSEPGVAGQPSVGV
jgi:O-antigen/teichoic acid export membrane protein